MTRRRWIADTWEDPSAPGTTASLHGDQAAHLARVLRAQPGTEYDIVAGDIVWHASIQTLTESVVTFQLIAPLEAAETLALTVLLSVFKFDRLEWAIEKLTELGVSTVQPVIVRRTEKHLAQAAVNRVERWRRIAKEASKQSRRTSVPQIDDPQSLKEVLGRVALDSSQPVRFLLAENEKQQSLTAVLQNLPPSNEYPKIILAVGPEGGWTPEEEALFAEHPWTPVTLGPTILRAETAAIAAVAIAAGWLNG